MSFVLRVPLFTRFDDERFRIDYFRRPVDEFIWSFGMNAKISWAISRYFRDASCCIRKRYVR